MFNRSHFLPLIISLAAVSLAAAPAMATDEVPAPPAPPAQPTQPSGGAVPCTDTSAPTFKIGTSASGAARKRVVRGTASDRGCGALGSGTVARVTISVSRKSGSRCQFMSSKGRLSPAKSCSRPTWLTAHGTSRWSFALPKRIGHGKFVIHARAFDSAGNVGLQRSLHLRIR